MNVGWGFRYRSTLNTAIINYNRQSQHLSGVSVENTESTGANVEDLTDDDVIVIPKSLAINVGIAILFFIIGGTAGVFGGSLLRDGANAPTGAAEALAAAPAQPTALPERLDNVSVDDDPFLGPENAAVTIVEFSDFRCPYCQRFYEDTLHAILDEYGDDVRFVYRDFPVVGGEQAALAAECANAQDGFWDYHDALYANPQAFNSVDDFVELAEAQDLDADEFRTCIESEEFRDEMVNDYNDGLSYGVSGTPTFFINGRRIVGAQPFSAFQSMIEAELGS
jgi:protein-disulfide isomerase